MRVDADKGSLYTVSCARARLRPLASRVAALSSGLSILAGVGASIVTVEFGRQYRAQRLLQASLNAALVATVRHAKPDSTEIQSTFATLFAATQPAGHGLAVRPASVRFMDQHAIAGSASASIRTVALWAIGVADLDVTATTRIRLASR